MLKGPAISFERRSALVRRVRAGKLGVRVGLATLAVAYIAVPTVLQWAALDGDRTAARAEAATIEPIAIPAPHHPEAAGPVWWFDAVPDALYALAGDTRSAGAHAGPLVAAAWRAAALVTAGFIAVVAGTRLGRPYRPRHATRTGFARIFL